MDPCAIGTDGFMQGNEGYIVFDNGSALDPEQTAHIALQRVEANGYTTIRDCEEMVHSFPNGDNDTEGPTLVANLSNNGFVLFFVVNIGVLFKQVSATSPVKTFTAHSLEELSSLSSYNSARSLNSSSFITRLLCIACQSVDIVLHTLLLILLDSELHI